ncbi:hypothetical protein AN957_02865 [Cytobacillus solani]|uniref:Uncharacterized protein n=1 Tax=Cytobacillus solani TaxID=1637975 RepID=A0A0Q3QIQ5_9BACI|nr:hypothetical protein AN957_02865 [Cytobacillus solani]
MSITNVKSVTKCQKCSTQGVVRRKEKLLVAMECPECKNEWKTYSKFCKECGEPNGYAVEGTCMDCYTVKHRSS